MARLRKTIGTILLAVMLVSGLLPGTSNAESIKWNKIDPALHALMDRNPNGTYAVIVEATTSTVQTPDPRKNAERAQRADDRVRARDGKAHPKLGIIGSVTASLSYRMVQALSNDPDVSYIHFDRPMRGAADPIDTANVWEQVVNAPIVWNLGYTGTGVGVAVLDSGIASAADITRPSNRVVARANLVHDNSTMPDPGGHGTHVAGIIAGDGFAAPADATNTYRGVAPNANLIDVRVLGSNGTTNVSTVIAGVEWTIQHRNNYNIRVMNLSMGAPVSAGYTYKSDPLAAALEMAWLSGIVVVTAAGNHGPNAGTIDSPGTDPMIITVGALDDNMTNTSSDDTIATFSSRGPTPDGFSKPDLIAPGRRIISMRDPGSYLDKLLPDRIMTTTVGSTYFRLSGTSMAAPVVAGTAALLIQKNPSLKPDQVKYILTHTARPVGKYDANTAGAGLLDVAAALNSNSLGRANTFKRPADTFVRSVVPYLKGQPLSWRDRNYGDYDGSRVLWDNVSWDNVSWDNVSWDNVSWDNVSWDNVSWDNVSWDNVSWDNVSWDNVSWDNVSWDNVSWDSAKLD